MVRAGGSVSCIDRVSRRMNSKLLAVSAFLAGISIASAQSTPPPIPLELRARFGFTGPLVRKVGDGISRLLVGDIDGDHDIDCKIDGIG